MPPRSVASRDESPPPIFPKGVLAVERMTVFDICAFRLRRAARRRFCCGGGDCGRRSVGRKVSDAPVIWRPLRVEVADKPLSEVESEFVGVLVFDGDDLPEPLAGAPGSEDVKASYKKATLVHPGTPRRALVVGLGARDEFTPERARVAAAIAARTAASMDASTLALKGPDGDDPAAATAMVEGAILASYRFDRFKSKGDDEDEDPKGLEEVTLIGDGGLAEAVEAARIGAEAENFARELQDLPSNVVTPSYLAGRAKAIAEEHDSVTFEVLGREQIKREGHGRAGRRLSGDRRGAAADRPPLPGGRGRDPRPGRQGRHLRLGRNLDQARRRDAGDEDGHVRGGRGARDGLGARQARAADRRRWQ